MNVICNINNKYSQWLIGFEIWVFWTQLWYSSACKMYWIKICLLLRTGYQYIFGFSSMS